MPVHYLFEKICLQKDLFLAHSMSLIFLYALAYVHLILLTPSSLHYFLFYYIYLLYMTLHSSLFTVAHLHVYLVYFWQNIIFIIHFFFIFTCLLLIFFLFFF